MSSSVQPSLRKAFLRSALVILAITALAKLYSAFGPAAVLARSDHLLLVPYRWILVGVAGLELTVVAMVLVASVPKIKLLSILWLSTCFALYRFAKWFFNLPDPCHCLGDITGNLPLKPQAIDLGLKIIVAYLFAGSFALLIADRIRSRRVAPAFVRQPPSPGEPNDHGTHGPVGIGSYPAPGGRVA